jgi:enolase
MTKIVAVRGREILDSRGNPTVEAEVLLDGGAVATAAVPSGASTGEKEAAELRDGDKKRYAGKGTRKAAGHVSGELAAAILGKDATNQREIDQTLIQTDATSNKSQFGANAILSVSMAVARAAAIAHGLPLYRYLGGANASVLPVPCMNVLNGGKHADNTVDFQEFMIAPHNASSFSEAIRMGIETFHTLKSVLKSKGYSTAVGDEGGFAPDLKSNQEAIELILEAIARAGYKPGYDISICLDPASSEMWDDGKYVFFKSTKQALSSDELIRLWESWANQYPIILLEDGMGENDWEGWCNLTTTLGGSIELVGDDIFCTNARILAEGIQKGVANAILVKLNQIGTVTETLDTMQLAARHNYRCFVSHRSGETEDTFISDLTVATNAGHIKTGSGCRSERIAKFNQFLRIEENMNGCSRFGGRDAFAAPCLNVREGVSSEKAVEFA